MYGLDILAVTAEDAGIYTCRVVNPLGDAATSATLNFRPRQQMTPTPTGLQRSSLRPSIKEPLKKRYDLNVDEYFETHIVIDAVDEQSFSFQWVHNDQPVIPDDRVRVEYQNGKVTLRIMKVDSRDAGVWIIKVNNRFGESRSAASLVVNPPGSTPSSPHPPRQPAFVSQPSETVYEDENNTLFIELKVSPSNAKVVFMKDGQILTDSSHIKTVTIVNQLR